MFDQIFNFGQYGPILSYGIPFFGVKPAIRPPWAGKEWGKPHGGSTDAKGRGKRKKQQKERARKGYR